MEDDKLNAMTTNLVTNTIHAIFLFTYFLLALRHFFKKNSNFTFLIVVSFGFLFFGKVFGIAAHANFAETTTRKIWLILSILNIILSYSISHALNMSYGLRFIILLISCAALFFNTTSPVNNFLPIALSLLFVYIIAAWKSRNLTRIAFLAIVFSNVLWIALRNIENAILGYTIPVIWRYDNDIYHLCLIVSTFLLYKSIVRGDWIYPHESTSRQ